MIFRRLITPSCICFGICATGRVTPSMRARTIMSSSCGSKWMSEAPSSIACASVAWTSLTAGVSSVASAMSSRCAIGSKASSASAPGSVSTTSICVR